jgi:hypothetical protein
MKLGKQSVSIKALMRRNWLDTEMRVRVNEAKAQQYAEEMAEGMNFPLPVVFIDTKDELLRVGDGFHRILAHFRNRKKEIEVELRRGGRRDAILWNIEANREQRGLPFVTGDKRKCIITLLRDAECKKWSGPMIAETVGCHPSYVVTVRSMLESETAWKRPEITIGVDGYPRPSRLPSSVDREPERPIQPKNPMIECPRCKGTGWVRIELADLGPSWK